jgi:glutathione S-transferase
MAGEARADNGGRRGMTAEHYTLVIGDKNFSSWSLRPWIAMRAFGIPFTEERIRLRQPDSKAEILRHAPAGKVPRRA